MEQKYHLYSVQAQDILDTERFFLITPDYAYLYTQNTELKDAKEITDLGELPPLALEWLREQVSAVRDEYIRGHGADVLKQAENFTAAFRRELAKEQRKLARKKTH